MSNQSGVGVKRTRFIGKVLVLMEGKKGSPTSGGVGLQMLDRNEEGRVSVYHVIPSE